MPTENYCTNCGSVLLSTEKFCKNCGKANPNFSSNSQNSQKSSTDDINWLVFVLLLIFVWPAAIIYLVIKMDKKNNN